MTDRHQAYVTLSREVLRRLLKLPAGVKVRAIRMSCDSFDDAIDVCIEGPTLAPVRESDPTPRVVLVYSGDDVTVTATSQ